MRAVVPRYTLDMLDALPEYPGVRYELVDGVLLVTPAADDAQTELITWLIVLLAAGIPSEEAHIAPPGEVRVGPSYSLIADILVYPARFPVGTPWKDVTEWLLAIDIVSPISAIYDRVHKRRAYMALGVREYWVVDPLTRTVEVWHPADTSPVIHRTQVTYRTPGGSHKVTVDLGRLFRGITFVVDA